MERARQSDQTTGRTMLWKSKAMEDQPTLDSPAESTPDGGNFSDTRTT
jgi:hypothetical protein